MASPPISDYRVTLCPDAAMRRAAAQVAGPTDTGGTQYAERRQRRIDQVLADVAGELSLALTFADGWVEVFVKSAVQAERHRKASRLRPSR